MNLRFPEVFGLFLFVALLSSFAMPRSLSGRIENTFQFLFAPIAGPIQWVASGKDEGKTNDVPLLPEVSDEVERLRREKAILLSYAEMLRGQMLTLDKRRAEAETVGIELGELSTSAKVIAVDATAGRDALRLAGTAVRGIAKDQPVIAEGGLVGKVIEVGVGGQASVQLISDRGFKTGVRFGRFQRNAAGGMEIAEVPLGTTVLEGAGGGKLRIHALKLADVQRADLRVDDLVLLADTNTDQWPIEAHGYRVGVVVSIGEKIDAPGIADIVVEPGAKLLTLKNVLVVTGKPQG